MNVFSKLSQRWTGLDEMDEYSRFVRTVTLKTVLGAVIGLPVFLLAGWFSLIPWYVVGVLLGLFNFRAHARSIQIAVRKVASASGEHRESEAKGAGSWKAALMFTGRFAVVVLVLCLIQLQVGLAVVPAVAGFVLSYPVLFVTSFSESRTRSTAEGADVSATK